MTAAWPPADHSAAWLPDPTAGKQPRPDRNTTAWVPDPTATQQPRADRNIAAGQQSRSDNTTAGLQHQADHDTIAAQQAGVDAVGWPAADERLERGYRRLLLAYPGRHRHRHGTELVTTLLEMAAPGQRRPRLGDALHLVGSGLRLRFRLPAGRPIMVVAALLTALTLGGFGAAAGSWLGAQTFTSLPDDAAMTRLAQQAGATGEVQAHRQSTNWHAGRVDATGSASGWDAEQVRQRFADAGWAVSGLTPLSGKSVTTDESGKTVVETPLSGDRFTAESNGLIIEVRGYLAEDRGTVSVDARQTRTAAFLPLVLVGTLLGLVVGWLIAAAVAYRIAGTAPGRRVIAAGAWGLALFALALPAVALYGNLVRVLGRSADEGGLLTVHSAFTPGAYYYPAGPAWLILGLSIAGLLAVVVAVLVARPGEQPPQSAVAAG
ncbi:hypothetical protein [Micromonospora sp. DT229]|uniref:hypothetical protein n=1 Tax=Micromonospora sp. DT229 TaxID=3393430 RepID=UPI003CE89526